MSTLFLKYSLHSQYHLTLISKCNLFLEKKALLLLYTLIVQEKVAHPNILLDRLLL